MFHFPASPPAPYELQTRVTPHNGRRVPPFGNPRITARKPAPRGISQATASFIGPRCQGIHRTLKTNEPINTQHTQVEPQQRQIAEQQYRCSRPLCSSQPTRPQPPTPPKEGGPGARTPGRTAPEPDSMPRPSRPRPENTEPLRKEVIQPHLPVRLPCYDFVPITGPAFDRSPWGHGLRASPTFMT